MDAIPLKNGDFYDVEITFYNSNVTGETFRSWLSTQRFSVKSHQRKFPLIRSRAPSVINFDANKGILTLILESKMLRKISMLATVSVLAASTAFADGHSKDIVDTAVEAGTFNTLVAAVEAAGLVETLKGEGPFTVFAPTDEAFAALPEGTVESLLLPENKDQLVAILTYHVVPGKVMSGDLSDDMMATTVQGSDVMIDLDNGVMVQDATVVSADIETSNGVIHVIDKVILPK